MVTHTRGAFFWGGEGSATPLHIAQCVARSVSDSK